MGKPYRECPHCGAHLDAGERCDCGEPEQQEQTAAEVWTVAKYAVLTLAGIMLFQAGQARALIDRGYAAIGGEVFTLFLPAYYFIISKLARDVIADKQGNSKNN